MTTPPSRWREAVTNLAVTVLAVALMLYIAARLIVAVLPVLVGAGVVVIVGVLGWMVYQHRRSRW